MEVADFLEDVPGVVADEADEAFGTPDFGAERVDSASEIFLVNGVGEVVGMGREAGADVVMRAVVMAVVMVIVAMVVVIA